MIAERISTAIQTTVVLVRMHATCQMRHPHAMVVLVSSLVVIQVTLTVTRIHRTVARSISTTIKTTVVLVRMRAPCQMPHPHATVVLVSSLVVFQVTVTVI